MFASLLDDASAAYNTSRRSKRDVTELLKRKAKMHAQASASTNRDTLAQLSNIALDRC